MAGFDPLIPEPEWPQTHALDRAATGVGRVSYKKEVVCIHQLCNCSTSFMLFFCSHIRHCFNPDP